MNELQKLVKERAVMLSKLSDVLGISYGTIMNHMSGRTKISVPCAYKYSQFFDVSVERFLIDQKEEK